MLMLKDAYALWKSFRHSREKSCSLHMRLFIFLAFFVSAVILLFFLILLSFGIFNSSAKESRIWMQNELEHAQSDIYSDFGNLSIRGVHMAETLTNNMESSIKEKGITSNELSEYPNLLEELLSEQAGILISVLNNNNCSGVFILLDATVNPTAENADFKKAGIFFKRTEPNAASLMGSKVHYLRGPAQIARDNRVGLLGQWAMEFDVSDQDFYDTTMNTAKKNSTLPINRLYYWSNRILLKNNSESGMLLCIPLIDKNKNVYGICGIEVSSMLFKLSYSPDNTQYPRTFTSLAPVATNNTFNMDAGLLAGNSYLTNPITGTIISTSASNDLLTTYKTDSGLVYGGLSTDVKMYPSGSAFEHEKWMISLMMPSDDLIPAVRSSNTKLYLALLLLLAFSLLGASFVSRHFISPVIDALNMLKIRDPLTSKTKFLEINDLLEFLSEQDKAYESNIQKLITTKEHLENLMKEPTANMDAYQAFICNIEMLSPAERAVFNLYMEGYTAQEITQILHLSINTIKTHNKRIFMKLNVTSRKELMIFAGMMKTSTPHNR